MAGGILWTMLILLLVVAYSRQEYGQPLVSNGRDTHPNEVPWNVGIYRQVNGTFDHLCGGTLISKKVVVTAAHCFWNLQYNRFLEGPYVVGLGKYYRGLYVREDSAQKIAVKDVHLHKRFRGAKSFYNHDIAVVVLNKTARVTNAVQVATVDWTNQHEASQMVNGNVGTVAGWGITETGDRSNALKTVALPYLDSDTCFDMLDDVYQPFVTVDKFCAGFTDKSISVCPGDSGGGLMFQDNATNLWYLRGVVSISFKPADFRGRCYDQQVTGFTTLSSPGILHWIRSYIKELKATPPPPGFTLPYSTRRDWGALPPDQVIDALPLPATHAVVSHTVTESCANSDQCKLIVRNVQAHHQSIQWLDVGFSFLIGGDGVVYEGRGWDTAGAHTLGYNYCSIGISFIGTYTTVQPSSGQLMALNSLLLRGIELGKLTQDYQLIGARQVGPTDSPGQALYDVIKKLPHWSASPAACTATS